MTCDGVILCGDIDSEFSLSFTEGNIRVNRLYMKFIKKGVTEWLSQVVVHVQAFNLYGNITWLEWKIGLIVLVL